MFYSWPLGSYAPKSPQEGVIDESGGIYFKEMLFKDQAILKNHSHLEMNDTFNVDCLSNIFCIYSNLLFKDFF